MNANERIERTVKGAIEMAATRREQYREYQSGTPFGMGTATNEEFAAIFEERINGRLMRDEMGFPVIDEMGQMAAKSCGASSATSHVPRPPMLRPVRYTRSLSQR